MLSIALLVMVFAPVAGAAVVLALGDGARGPRTIALAAACVSAVGAIVVTSGFDASATAPAIQMDEFSKWTWLADVGLPRVGGSIRFHLAVDGISLWLIVLTALLSVTAVLVSWEAVRDRPRAFYALLLALETGMIGVFAAQDIILFYIFFEFTLIPLFFLIGIWGGAERRPAARKFFIYTLTGSVLTFLGLIYIVAAYYEQTAVATVPGGRGVLTFSIPELTANLRLTAPEQYWVFLALFAGFAIKVPIWPFHTWLPLAHVEAPTAGSVLLAGVLLKIGTYGLLRFSLPLLPDASLHFFGPIAVLAVIGIVYGALVALAQDDIKKLVAYSSVSHLGFCVLGLFALNQAGIAGSLLQMVNHGLSTGALFALVGMLYERFHTREIKALGGLARRMPLLAFFFMVMTLSSIGLPGLNGFVGEFLVLIGMFQVSKLFAALAAIGIILGAWYMLWLTQRILFGPFKAPGHAASGDAAESAAHDSSHGGHEHAAEPESPVSSPGFDLNLREVLALAPIAVACLWIGLVPNFFLSRMEPALRAVADRVSGVPSGMETRIARNRAAQERLREVNVTRPSPPAPLPGGEGSEDSELETQR